MRFLITLLMVLSSTAFAEFNGEILSYTQLMGLTPLKRMNYISELRGLMVFMEAQDTKLELASAPEQENRHAQMALLLKMFTVLPEAEAAEPSACEEPKLSCSEGKDAAKKAAAIAAFRKITDKDSDSCIVGGFFSSYKDPSHGKRVGGCRVPREFPPFSKSPAQKCKAREAMCNPWLFCATISPVAGLNGPIEPQAHCVPLGGKAGIDVTQRCKIWFDGPDESHGKGGVIGKVIHGGTDIVRACDPGEELKNPGMHEAWNDLKKSMDTNYRKRCQQDKAAGFKSDKNAGFQELFCSECKVIAKRIYDMTKEAIFSGCAKSEALTGPAMGFPKSDADISR